MRLSILVPGIRVQNWTRLYNSIDDSFSGEWEMIFIGPYELPTSLAVMDNVKYIEDWGTPIKCQQRGLVAAKGEYITWAADDGVFTKNSLDKGFELLKEENYKTVITGKYIEGTPFDDHMENEKYYILSNHDDTEYVPKGYYMLNVGLVSRELLYEIGGWDCRFEVCPMAYNDLAIRLQNLGCKFILQPEIMFRCSHLPLCQGDHGPIHHAQTDHDIPVMKELYKSLNPKERMVIGLDNWMNCDEVWKRRFSSIIS